MALSEHLRLTADWQLVYGNERVELKMFRLIFCTITRDVANVTFWTFANANILSPTFANANVHTNVMITV